MSSPFITTVAAYYGIDYVPPASLDDFSCSFNGVETVTKHDHDVGKILNMADHLRREKQGRPMDTIRQSEVLRHGPSELQAWRDAAELKAYSAIEEGEHLCGRYERMHGVCVPSIQERGFITPGGGYLEPSVHKHLRMGEPRAQTVHSSDALSMGARVAMINEMKAHGVPHTMRLCETARRQGDIDRACSHESATRHASMSQDEMQHLRRLANVRQQHANSEAEANNHPFPNLRSSLQKEHRYLNLGLRSEKHPVTVTPSSFRDCNTGRFSGDARRWEADHHTGR